MAKDAKELDRVIRLYIETLGGLGIRDAMVYLYGSYARDKATDESDIDLIVISKDFLGKNLRERLELLGMAAARIMEPIQSLGYTPEELAAQETGSFTREVLLHARRAA